MSERASETRAAVLTGKGTAALATIQLYGCQASQLIQSVFRSVSSQPAALDPASISLGTIHDDGQTIDQVTVGCEDRNLFAIHCHGNPLIVEQIMELLQRRGATLLPAEQLLTDLWMDRGTLSATAMEAKLILPRAKTLLGTRLLHHQIQGARRSPRRPGSAVPLSPCAAGRQRSDRPRRGVRVWFGRRRRHRPAPGGSL